MQEKSLKTSTKQRIFIAIIAITMLVSSLAAYVGIIIANGKETESISPETKSDIAKLSDSYKEKMGELKENLSKQYLSELVSYKSNVKGYNSASVNDEGLITSDLKEGDGATLSEDNNSYLSYYIGWCADEKVFDSSFDSYDNPTALKEPLYQVDFIEGWKKGVIGMKLGGVRLISIPGKLAYTTNGPCGESAPLKFVVMTINPSQEQTNLLNEIDVINAQFQALYQAQQSSNNK